MARKTLLKQFKKWLPTSSTLQRAFQADQAIIETSTIDGATYNYIDNPNTQQLKKTVEKPIGLDNSDRSNESVEC